MNKQQLAAKIWKSANKMRSKIEANEYKDYILGFIFYKFLSEKEEKFLKDEGWTDEYLASDLHENDTDTVEYLKKNIGYFIDYDNLFSTWLKKGRDFTVQDVRDALSAFNRGINPAHKKVFDGIFDTLQTGLSKLGESAASQSKAISDLIQLIRDIPMDGKQGYDVLGFIYEYLLEQFAANSGKKAGEFYTPHEVSVLMSEIVANHLKDRESINIYDPTSGSGSLLINIGKSAARYIDGEKRIRYYAQELKQNTYNLTRMNLFMRGIDADRIITRNGDTLEDDWPYFDENDPVGTYDPLYVDAVVSNPPYSQNWDPTNKETDPRYKEYGLAPKSKADYAFLLHDLYHLKPDGIMTIVLPHGVLFRGGEEGEIRKNLIENSKIDAIIGLPPNIFFGTGIPTIIMILKQKRTNTDVLIVDASKGYIKDGDNNKLRASDIKRIADTVIQRSSIDKYSKVVTRDEIRANDYNLNIPRYVDSSDPTESWDIYASMFGGIPEHDIDNLNEYWKAFPSLREDLFGKNSGKYAKLYVDDIKRAVTEHVNIKDFENSFRSAFSGFDEYLSHELIEHMKELNLAQVESVLSDNIFERLSDIPLIDKYEAYQLLDDKWEKIAADLELIQTEGFNTIKTVNPNLVIKKKNGKEQEIQEGWKGRIIPFELAQQYFLTEETSSLRADESRFEAISAEYDELIDQLSEDDKQKLLNDDNTAFVPKEVSNACKEILADISTPETLVLDEYLELSSMKEKLAFIEEHPEISWEDMTASKNGTYSKSVVSKYGMELKSKLSFDEDTYEYAVTHANSLIAEEKNLKKSIKEKQAALHLKTKEVIENLSDVQAKELLYDKWVVPIIDELMQLPHGVVYELVSKIEVLTKKYETTLADVENQIIETENSLSAMIDELEGDEFDMLGLSELKNMLGGDVK